MEPWVVDVVDCVFREQAVEAAFPIVVGGDGGVVDTFIEAGGVGQFESVRLQFMVDLVGVLAAFHAFVQASEVLLEEGEGEEVGEEGWVEAEAVEEHERSAARRGGRGGRQGLAVALGEGKKRGRLLHGLGLRVGVVERGRSGRVGSGWVGGWMSESVMVCSFWGGSSSS